MRIFFWRIFTSAGCCKFKGRIADAIPEFQKAFDLNSDLYSLAMLGQAYARKGQEDEAQKVLAQLNELAKSRYVAPYAGRACLSSAWAKRNARSLNWSALIKAQTPTIFLSSRSIRCSMICAAIPRFEALVQKVIGGK